MGEAFYFLPSYQTFVLRILCMAVGIMAAKDSRVLL